MRLERLAKAAFALPVEQYTTRIRKDMTRAEESKRPLIVVGVLLTLILFGTWQSWIVSARVNLLAVQTAKRLLGAGQATPMGDICRHLFRKPVPVGIGRLCGRLATHEGRWNEATGWLEDVIAAKPNDSYSLLSLGLSYWQLGQQDEAKDAWTALLEYQPSAVSYFARACQGAITFVIEPGDPCWQAIEPVVRRAVDDGGVADPKLLRLLGERAELAGDFAEAERRFRAAVDAAPTDGLAHQRLGDFLLARGRFEEAIAAYQLALRYGGVRHQTYFELGQAYEELGQLEVAVEWYGRAIADYPNAFHFHLQLAEAYIKLERCEEAQRTLIEAGPYGNEAERAYANARLAAIQARCGQ